MAAADGEPRAPLLLPRRHSDVSLLVSRGLERRGREARGAGLRPEREYEQQAASLTQPGPVCTLR